MLALLRAAARSMGQWAEKGEWFSIDDQIWVGRFEVGYMRDPELAKLAALMLKLCIPSLNEIIRLRAQVADLKKMLEVRV